MQTTQALRKATHQQTRQINNRLVLRTIFDGSPVSRAEVARLTDLTRTTVSDVVEQLIGAGLVEEIGRGRSTGGKAPILMEVPADARHLIGIDVGDGKVSGAIVNLRGEVRHSVEIPLDGRDGDQALGRLDDLLEQLLAATERPLLGVGLGTPGLIDTSTGTVRWAVNLDWRDLPLGEHLQARTGLPVYVANDSHAAALAEFTFGGHTGARSMVVVRVGRGIGAGIVLDGRLHQGDGFGAGEIGHTAVADNYRPCRCGSTGCLETIASTRAVVQRAREVAPHAPESALHRTVLDGLSFDDLVSAFEAGDELAREIIVEAAHQLGRAIGGLVGVLNVRHIVLVGEMTRLGDPWLSVVRREAHRSALALLADQTLIEIGRVERNVVAVGAAALLMTRELGLSLAG
ncbi:MAG: ROK family transcriptional regulator [Candidatus Limnocylindria bacterium]